MNLHVREIVRAEMMRSSSERELTVEPALLFAEAGPQERVLRLRREMVQKGRQPGDQKGPTPGVTSVDS